MFIIFYSKVSSLQVDIAIIPSSVAVSHNYYYFVTNIGHFFQHSRTYNNYYKVYAIYFKSLALQLHIKIGFKVVLTCFKTI